MVSFKACPFLAFVCRTCSGTPTPFTAPVRLPAGCATTQVCMFMFFHHQTFVSIILISSFFYRLCLNFVHFCQKRSVLPKDLLTSDRGPIPFRATGAVWNLSSCVSSHQTCFLFCVTSSIDPSTDSFNHHEQYATLSLTNLRDTRLRLIAPQCPYA